MDNVTHIVPDILYQKSLQIQVCNMSTDHTV